ncbi:anti-sigma factor [Arthrobacter sp. BE255]|uniref:anti-sigma factor n=1 Tax=Arthrobacter sp. BE255 TaxID=2817721 RepID=UPI00285B6D35|nr:anti-sigma factor [Arthrobacter sp. BE255]MDR7157639.1 anti-sigma-K factor RskA [Arthrobacter sp. BE255]
MTSDNPLFRRHPRNDSHVRSCPECASAVHRERQYIERLREAAIPPASQELTARLLQQTHALAMAPCEPSRSPHRGAKIVALAAGGTAAAVGVLAAGAFALAGDPLPMAANAAAGSFVQQSANVPADGRELSAEQLAGLRTEGWVCPGLESMGFHILSARATTLDGVPAVEMKLSDGEHYAKVLEQHGGAATTDGGVSVRSSAPWTAVVRSLGSTITYESDLPADRADDAVPVLQRLSALANAGIRAGAAPEPPAAGSGPSEPFSERLQRGLEKIARILTP